MTRALSKSTRSALFTALAVLVSVFALGLVSVPTARAETTAPPISITATFPEGEPQAPELTSTAALVMDADSGKVLFAKKADERLPMASTTKIMTAILVLESLDLDTRVLVSRNAHFQGGSVVGLHALDSVTVEQLLYWLMVFSGNDAAVALAEKTSGNVDEFVARMNEKAQSLGLTNTHFTNPNGLQQSGHYSSCTDLAALARYAMQNEVFRRIVNTANYDLPHPNAYTPTDPHNSNALLTKYDWVTGIKTGSTPAAGYCVVASGTQYGVSLIAVQLGAKDDETRWKEAEALFDYGFALSPLTALARPGRTLVTIPVGDPLGQIVELTPKDRLITRLREGEVATGTVTLLQTPVLPIPAGEVMGSVEFTLNGKSLGKTTLVSRLTVHIPTPRRILVEARNWYLPEFQLSDRGERYPH